MLPPSTAQRCHPSLTTFSLGAGRWAHWGGPPAPAGCGAVGWGLARCRAGLCGFAWGAPGMSQHDHGQHSRQRSPLTNLIPSCVPSHPPIPQHASTPYAPSPLLQDAAAVTMTAAKAGYFEARFFHKVFCEEFANARGHFSPINSVAFSPDGTSFVTGAEEGNVRLHHFDADYVSGWVAGWECVCVCWSAGEV